MSAIAQGSEPQTPNRVSKSDQPITLNKKRLREAAEAVALLDQDLARILADLGPPPLWARKPGFATMLRIILEQQVSLASADAMYRRLTDHIKPLTPLTVLQFGAPSLRTLGVTRQKAAYFINLAEAVQNGAIKVIELGTKSDRSVFDKLTSVNGIGPWTANIYLLMALRRPDAWPVGDVALASAVQKLKGLEKRPSQPELTEIANSWQPYRSTAARLLWHYYLNGMPRAQKT